MTIDGVEVDFVPLDEGVLEVLAGSERRVLGRLYLGPDGLTFRAQTRDARVLRHPSPWGGMVTAYFRTRELGARALLEAEAGR